MARLTMQPEEVLQAKADVLQKLMVDTLRASLRGAAQSLGASLTAAATNPEDPAWRRAETQWMEAVSGDFFPHVVGAYADAAEDIHLQLIGLYDGPAEDVPYVNQEQALSYLRDTANRMVATTEGTWARARGQLIEGFAAGESIEELSARLQSVTDWSASRAATVARTEIISASNAGALAEVRTLNPDASKEWMATKDSRTREWHREADGETVLLDGTFTVGPEELDFPGDPSGSPANVINCRCALAFIIPREAVAAAVEQYGELRDVTDEFDPADFVDFGSLTAALGRHDFLTKRPFDESKHRRGHGGKFVRKGEAGKIHSTKGSPESPPATAESGSGEVSTPSPEPAEPVEMAVEVDEWGDPIATPNAAVVEVTEDVIDGLDLDEGIYAEVGQRVLVGERLGTIRHARENESGLTGDVFIQFDDNPREVETLEGEDIQVITGADEEAAMEPPFDANIVANMPPDAGGVSGAPAPPLPADTARTPFEVSPGFELVSPDDAQVMQNEMTESNPWTVRQEDALIAYSGGNYRYMNDCLRRGELCSEGIERDNRSASQAMRPTTRPTTGFRSANFASLGVRDHSELEGLVGATVTDAGFTSTSVDPRFLETVSGDVRLQIEVPQGSMAAYIDQISENGSNSAASVPEYELLLNSGTRFEVLEVGRASGRSIVRVRVLP